jgi:regulator of RNase E activity RraA
MVAGSRTPGGLKKVLGPMDLILMGIGAIVGTGIFVLTGTGAVTAGPALTVKTRPGEHLMIHKAILLAAPGDVIVVDGGGDLTNALIGELMVGTAIQRKLGGFVIDGAIRDAKALREGDFPVFAAGVTHRGPYRDGPGEINVPIALDGMVIEPGDLIIGDDDGVLCVPFDHVESVLDAARKKSEAEAATVAAIAAGQVDTAWIDATLNRLGCPIEGQ